MIVGGNRAARVLDPAAGDDGEPAGQREHNALAAAGEVRRCYESEADCHFSFPLSVQQTARMPSLRAKVVTWNVPFVLLTLPPAKST